MFKQFSVRISTYSILRMRIFVLFISFVKNCDSVPCFILWSKTKSYPKDSMMEGKIKITTTIIIIIIIVITIIIISSSSSRSSSSSSSIVHHDTFFCCRLSSSASYTPLKISLHIPRALPFFSFFKNCWAFLLFSVNILAPSEHMLRDLSISSPPPPPLPLPTPPPHTPLQSGSNQLSH